MEGSSSRRRKKQHHRPKRFSNSRTRAVDVPTTARTLTFDGQAITTGPGFKLLLKSGWVPGQTLGASNVQTSTTSDSSQSDIDASLASTPNNALSAPLPIVVRNGRGGVGSLSRSADSVIIPILSTCDDGSNGTSCRKGLKNSRKVHHKRGQNHSQRFGHSHPRFFRKNSHNHDNSVDSSSLFDEAESPRLVRHLASLEIFDPLRPRCQYDPDHIVRDLKALHKHEQSCPANPNRESLRRESVSSLQSIQVTPTVLSSILQDDDISCTIMDSPVSLSSDMYSSSDSRSDSNFDIDSVLPSDSGSESDSESESGLSSDSDACTLSNSYDFGVVNSEFDGVDWNVLSSLRTDFVTTPFNMEGKDIMDCDD